MLHRGLQDIEETAHGFGFARYIKEQLDKNEIHVAVLGCYINPTNPVEELRDQTRIFKERLAKGETLDDLLPEAFATVREAARRTLNMEHFPVQLIGGIVLHQGRIAEMRTGEGKKIGRASCRERV